MTLILFRDLLTNNSKINTVKIKHLTNIIMFELTHKKYSYETISKIIDNIFTTYQIAYGVLLTNFPHNITCNSLEASSPEFKEYEENIKIYIDKLVPKDRILAINNYLIKEPEELRFIFQINGLKGDDVNITMRNVQIYNPKTTRICNNSVVPCNELFREKIKDNIYYCNGAVALKVIDAEYGKYEALQKLESILDIISSQYSYYKTPIKINIFKYFAIDSSGNMRHSGSTNTWEFITYQDSLDINNARDDSFPYISQIETNKMIDIDKKILESIHWKRKAIESNEIHEKILWHWIALENIFNIKNKSTPKTIFEVTSKLLAKEYIFKFAWNHYYKLLDITDRMAPYCHYRFKLTLPNDLIYNIGLEANEGESIYLKNLINNIDNIKCELNVNSLFFEQMEVLKEIFLDASKCLSLMEKFEKIFYDKLVYIYRIRNKIVHNAYSETNPLSKYYADIIASVSNISINAFIDKRDKLSLKDNEDIICNIKYDYDEFKLRLKEEGANILL